MWSFDLASFFIGLFCGCLLLILIACFVLLIAYLKSSYEIIIYILEHKEFFEKSYFKITCYKSAKAVFKLLSDNDKNKICEKLEIDSFWEGK